MSTQINATDIKRGDRYFVDPFQVVVKEELRGRHVIPDLDDIARLAVSMLTDGQLQAVVCRRDEQNRPVLVAGFTRTAACRLIRTGFQFEGQDYHDPEFRLQFTLTDCNDAEAFRRNIVENCHRNATTPIDDAHNQRRLRDAYGLNDSEIAKLYEVSPNKVCQYKKLLSLSSDEQTLVHIGQLSVATALNLLEVPAEDRAVIVANATTDSGKVSGAVVRESVRNNILNDNSDPLGLSDGTPTVAPEPSKLIPRSMKEVKSWLSSTVDDENTTTEIKNFCEVFLKYIEGRKTTKQLENALKKIEKVDALKVA